MTNIWGLYLSTIRLNTESTFETDAADSAASVSSAEDPPPSTDPTLLLFGVDAGIASSSYADDGHGSSVPGWPIIVLYMLSVCKMCGLFVSLYVRINLSIPARAFATSSAYNAACSVSMNA